MTTSPKPKVKRGFTDMAAFIDAVRECLGKDPLYRRPQRTELERFYAGEYSSRKSADTGGRVLPLQVDPW